MSAVSTCTCLAAAPRTVSVAPSHLIRAPSQAVHADRAPSGGYARRQLDCRKSNKRVQLRAQLRSTSDFFEASEKVSDVASNIAKKMAALVKEVDAEAHNKFGSIKPATADTELQLGFHVDLRESAHAYQCIADMPGISKQHIKVLLAAPAFTAICWLGWHKLRHTMMTLRQPTLALVQVEVDKEQNLCIKGERLTPADSKEWKYNQQERETGTLQRKFELPEDADTSNVSAKLVEGVLTITVNKLDT